MANAAADGLRIRFGLQSQPTDAQIKQWADIVRQLRASGYSADQAGAAAAKQVFRDFNTMHYASEADTIEALLRLAADK